MSRHVHEYLDVAGRPIGEGRAKAFERVRTEMRSCPYAGARYQHAKPMNVTALQQMPDWQHVLTMLSWLSQRYRAASRTEVTTYDDLAQVTGAGVFLVDFLVLRRRRSLRSGEIPVLIAGLYKACLGLQLAYLPERFAQQTVPTRLPDAAGFYAYLEESELLIGEAEVCSGSAAMIMQAYDAIIDRHNVGEDALPPPCGSLEIDWGRFDIFTHQAGEIWRDLVLYAIEQQRFLPRLAEPGLPPDVQGRLNALLEQRGTKLLDGQAGLAIDIGRAARFYNGQPDPAPASVARPLAHPRPPSLAASLLAWLWEVDGADMHTYAPEVAGALHNQLDAYETYEAAVLDSLNQHLSLVMQTLELDRPGTLTASALLLVYGQTLRDWEATWL